MTASKSFVLLITAYILFKFLNKKFITILFLIMFFLLGKFLVPKNVDYEGSHMRILAIFFSQEDLMNRERDDRIKTWDKIISSSNFFVGNGLGSTYRTNINYINPESYLLQIYSEAGIIGLFLFLLLLYDRYNKSTTRNKIFISMIGLSCAVVHSFASPVFFGAWSIILLDPRKS